MKILLSALFFFSSTLAHSATMNFTYESNEIAPAFCTHEQIRDLPDWKILCKTPYETKEFVAHVIVREYQKEDEPKTSLELLYWVTERNAAKPPLFHSATSMIRLKKGSSIDSLRLSQSVENDYASLVMEWMPGDSSK